MVEQPDDSIGPSPLLHGSECRKWTRLIDLGNIVDTYLCAAIRKGPNFTRQALRGSRFDQARLDMIYCNNRANWCSVIRQIDHDDCQTLSYHLPVLVTFAHQDISSTSNNRKFSYFKMDAKLLQKPEIMEQSKGAWGTDTDLGKDARIHWDLAVLRMKKVLITEKQQIDELTRRQPEILIQFQWREVALNPTPLTIAEVVRLEAEVKANELREAEVCRRHRV